MATSSPIQRTVVLHVGMHKTASTYVQRRLRKNRRLLRSNGLFLPTRRKQDNLLLDALAQERWKPWKRRLERAEARNCNLLVSHEALSCSLHQPSSDGWTPRGMWLEQQLKRRGWKLKVIGFIRDQESYLNSRYTQLVKRLSVRCDFSTYIEKVMKGNTISECDLITLFGWLKQSPGVEAVMIPFGTTRDQQGHPLPSRPDPFRQLLHELALPEVMISQCKSAPSLNQQPGRLGVALALEIKNFLRQHHPYALKHYGKNLRSGIEDLAQEKGWTSEPFNGLTSALQEKIRAHYQSSNAEFCRHFWANVSWEDLFWTDDQAAKSLPTAEWNATIDAELIACREQVIADTLPDEIVAELPK